VASGGRSSGWRHKGRGGDDWGSARGQGQGKQGPTEGLPQGQGSPPSTHHRHGTTTHSHHGGQSPHVHGGQSPNSGQWGGTVAGPGQQQAPPGGASQPAAPSGSVGQPFTPPPQGQRPLALPPIPPAVGQLPMPYGTSQWRGATGVIWVPSSLVPGGDPYQSGAPLSNVDGSQMGYPAGSFDGPPGPGWGGGRRMGQDPGEANANVGSGSRFSAVNSNVPGSASVPIDGTSCVTSDGVTAGIFTGGVCVATAPVAGTASPATSSAPASVAPSVPVNGTTCVMSDGVTAGLYTNGVCVATAPVVAASTPPAVGTSGMGYLTLAEHGAQCPQGQQARADASRNQVCGPPGVPGMGSAAYNRGGGPHSWNPGKAARRQGVGAGPPVSGRAAAFLAEARRRGLA
jgi:hypothetical protein